jgi:hypothetical protein
MAVDVKSKASSCLLLRTLRELVAGDEADVLTSTARTASR